LPKAILRVEEGKGRMRGGKGEEKRRRGNKSETWALQTLQRMK
jgi:hypothetical protein